MKILLLCFCLAVFGCSEYPDRYMIEYTDEEIATCCNDVTSADDSDVQTESSRAVPCADLADCKAGDSVASDGPDTGANTGIGTSTDTVTGIGTESDTDDDIGADTDTDVDIDTGTDTDVAIDTDTYNVTDADTDTDTDTDTDADMDTDTDTDTGSACNDNDYDGWCPPADCNDNDPFVNPGAEEDINPGNGIDEDCDGLTDEKPTK